MKKVKVGLIIFLLAYIMVFFSSFRPLLPGYHTWYYTPEKYSNEKVNIRKSRKGLNNTFSHTNSKREKGEVLGKAAKQFQKSLMNKIFPYWYGTLWTFSGTTEVPGESSIACGYFVTTTLRDIGVKLNRSKLAQVASEEMIKKLVSAKHISRYHNISINSFVSKILQLGDGVYIVGLDNHTGYIIVENNIAWFIHSSGRFPFSVVKENALNSTTLAYSKYKVLGSISKDEKFIENWLSNLD